MLFQNDPSINDYTKGKVTAAVDISIYGVDFCKGQHEIMEMFGTHGDYAKGYGDAIKEHESK